MVPNLDFLPAEYHQTRRSRQKKVWRRGVCIICLLLIGLGFFQQQQTRHELEAMRDRLRQQAADMAAQLDSAAPLRQQIDHLEAKANLVTYLRIRVPPTRMLACVTNSLPPFVTLTEFRLTREKLPTKAAAQPTSRKERRKAEEAASSKLPEERDLERLQQRDGETALFVSLRGVAADDVAVSEYLATLRETGTFDEILLVYTHQHTSGDEPLRSFAVRLRVRTPALGKTGGTSPVSDS